MDKTINPSTHDYDGSFVDTLQNALYLRLTTPRGEYWADKELGSLLHMLRREKDLSNVGLLAQQYASEALAPIVSDGRAKSINVTHEQGHNSQLLLAIEVVDARDQKQLFKHNVNVI